jgi:hypothetical protein
MKQKCKSYNFAKRVNLYSFTLLLFYFLLIYSFTYLLFTLLLIWQNK